MKTILTFSALTVGLLVSGIVIIFNYRSSQDLLVGKWEEVSWEYEKVNHNGDLTNFVIDEGQKQEICENMIIHKAEIWNFDSSGNLILESSEHLPEKLKWKVKGRGHILELQHGDNSLEGYQIQEISEDTLIIHFNCDIQIRGIVKITFKRLKENHATKV